MLSKLYVYSRDNCHLCHDMVQDLRVAQTRRAFEFEVIEIDGEPELETRFGHMVPVLTFNEQVLCFGRLDVGALHAVL
ncbi:MAG: glutaredoxin family protein [Formosimonas sp.]